MLKIATHDSATGEKCHGILSWLVIPFSKTQSKTIAAQYNAGCRQFDLRVRNNKRGWICAHGLWTTKRTAADILSEINDFPEKCHVSITYEGTLSDKVEFQAFAKEVKEKYANIIWGPFCTKYADKMDISCKVAYVQVEDGSPEFAGGTQGFLALDGRSWHTYLPIPWLWDRIYSRPHKFNEDGFIYVDFL